MLSWMCRVKAEEDVRLHNMYSRLSLPPLESKLRIIQLSWYVQVQRSEEWINHLVGCQGRRRPHKTWEESVKEGLCLWKIKPKMPHGRTK